MGKAKFKCIERYVPGDTSHVHEMLIQAAKDTYGYVSDRTLELTADRIMESCRIQGGGYAV